MSKGKHLVSVSGQGPEYSEETGRFEIKCSSGVKEFSSLTEAMKFYDELEEESAIWDITSIPELIDCKVLKDDD